MSLVMFAVLVPVGVGQHMFSVVLLPAQTMAWDVYPVGVLSEGKRAEPGAFYTVTRMVIACVLTPLCPLHRDALARL